MAASDRPAAGVTVAYSTNNGNAYTSIGLISSVKGVGGSEMGMRDTTVLSSSRHTMKPSIPAEHSVTFGLLADPNDNAHKQVIDWSANAAAADPTWKFTFPFSAVNNTCTFNGPVKSVDGINGDDVDGNLEAEVEIQVNTPYTWA